VTSKLVLIYSMEPAIYADVNAAMRNLDTDKLHTLGPYTWGLYWIFTGTEAKRKGDDKIQKGAELMRKNDKLYNELDNFVEFFSHSEVSSSRESGLKLGKSWQDRDLSISNPIPAPA